jgi:hypothetical protein
MSIFIDFFLKNGVSQTFEKNEWISIYNTVEQNMHPCVCGHNVKHITYLFNEKNRNIVSVGTTCCKKYGLLGKHMKNEILIHVLREEISQHCFKNSGNLLTLEKDLGELLENYIYEKFSGIMKKYSRDMDENIYYFDVFYPLNRMMQDILELKNYGYDFSKDYDEISEILRERDMHKRETLEKTDTDSETNSEIMEKLDKIEQEISQLLNETISETSDFEYEESDLEKESLEENPEKDPEEISQLLRENSSETKDFEYEESDLVFEDEYLEESDLEENVRIEEEIQKEMEEENSKKEAEEKEAEEYLENNDKEMEETVTNYERNIENRYPDYQYIYTARDLKLMLGIQELNMRIKILKDGIEDYKKNFAVFHENLQQFKSDINIFSNKII